MTLADLLNKPHDFEYEGKVYKIRQPSIEECATYQRWLESEARCSAAAATDLPEADRRNLIRDTNADIAAKMFCWGGEACARSLTTPDGVAKLMSILCADQDVNYRLARQIVEHRYEELARLMRAANEGDDPDEKRALGQLLKNQGLPADYLRASSSAPATLPSEAPPISPESSS